MVRIVNPAARGTREQRVVIRESAENVRIATLHALEKPQLAFGEKLTHPMSNDDARGGRPQRVASVSLGCPKNLVDSEVMMGLLARAGAELSPRAEDADVIVVNTCSFIESAQQESVNTILEMAEHKTSGRAKKLIVAGCLVERFRDEIRKRIPEVDAVVGTGGLQNILAATGIGALHPIPIPRLWC